MAQRRWHHLAPLILVIFAGCGGSLAPSTAPASVPAAKPSASAEAIDQIAEALGEHHTVGLGEWHGSATEHAFFAGLLADPKVQSLVDVIVVEFGAAPEQALIDRFIAGESVADAELTRVWTTTTQQSGVWDSPIYRRFFERVRDLNRSMPTHAIRVVLGDPGIDAVLCGRPDLATDAPCIERDGYLANRINEAITTGSRVVVVAGVFHVWRTPGMAVGSATSRVESSGHPMFVLIPFGGPLLSDPAVRNHIGDLAEGELVRSSWLGEIDAGILRGATTVECDHPPCETEPPLGSLATVADAYIYLGG